MTLGPAGDSRGLFFAVANRTRRAQLHRMDAALALGIIGTGTSTALAIHQWRNERRTVRITSVPAYNGEGFHPVGQFIRVTIANHRANPVHVRMVFLSVDLHPRPFLGRLRNIIRYRRWMTRAQLNVHLPDDTICQPALPASIAPGRGLIVWLSRSGVEKVLAETPGHGLRLHVQDETDQTTTSPKLRT